MTEQVIATIIKDDALKCMKVECSMERNPILQIQLLSVLNDFRNQIQKDLDNFMDFCEKQTLNSKDVPEFIRDLMEKRKRNRTILNMINKITDMDDVQKEQLMRDLVNLVERGC